jgi:hypothetical protein
MSRAQKRMQTASLEPGCFNFGIPFRESETKYLGREFKRSPCLSQSARPRESIECGSTLDIGSSARVSMRPFLIYSSVYFICTWCRELRVDSCGSLSSGGSRGKNCRVIGHRASCRNRTGVVEQRPRNSNLRTHSSAWNNGFFIRAIDGGGVTGRRFPDRHFRERTKLVSRPVAGSDHFGGLARYFRPWVRWQGRDTCLRLLRQRF